MGPIYCRNIKTQTFLCMFYLKLNNSYQLVSLKYLLFIENLYFLFRVSKRKMNSSSEEEPVKNEKKKSTKLRKQLPVKYDESSNSEDGAE